MVPGVNPPGRGEDGNIEAAARVDANRRGKRRAVRENVMRLLLVGVGIFAIYRVWKARARRRVPSALLPDMRRRAAEEDNRVVYHVTEHDDGWAYRVGDVFSESYPTREQAVAAAQDAAAAHRRAGSDTFITYQDRQGRWHEEIEAGDDRPETRVDPGSGAEQRATRRTGASSAATGRSWRVLRKRRRGAASSRQK